MVFKTKIHITHSDNEETTPTKKMYDSPTNRKKEDNEDSLLLLQPLPFDSSFYYNEEEAHKNGNTGCCWQQNHIRNQDLRCTMINRIVQFLEKNQFNNTDHSSSSSSSSSSSTKQIIIKIAKKIELVFYYSSKSIQIYNCEEDDTLFKDRMNQAYLKFIILHHQQKKLRLQYQQMQQQQTFSSSKKTSNGRKTKNHPMHHEHAMQAANFITKGNQASEYGNHTKAYECYKDALYSLRCFYGTTTSTTTPTKNTKKGKNKNSKMDSSNTAINNEYVAQVLHVIGTVSQDLNNYVKAREYYKEALTIYNRLYGVLEGIEKEREEEFEETNTYITTATTSTSSSATNPPILIQQLYHLLSIAEEKLGNYNEAKEYELKALIYESFHNNNKHHHDINHDDNNNQFLLLTNLTPSTSSSSSPVKISSSYSTDGVELEVVTPLLLKI